MVYSLQGESTSSVSIAKDGQETSMSMNGDEMVGVSLEENSDGSIDASTQNNIDEQPKRLFAAHSSAFQYSFVSSIMVIVLTHVF